MFFVGQKVVCVDTSEWNLGAEKAAKGNVFPVKGGIYTIREVVDGDGLLLMEIVNPPTWWGKVEIGFFASRFRPVTDISDLKEIVAEVFNHKPRKIQQSDDEKRRVPA